MPFGPQRTPSGLFLVLALLVLVLSVDVFGFLGVGDPKGSKAAVAPSATAAWRALNADGRQLLDKEHDEVVSEIKLRIEHEHLLFSLKFGLVGAILWAFLQTPSKTTTAVFDTTPFAAMAAWAAVVASAIVDLRVMSNQSFLITLGGWSRQYEQLALGANAATLGWEAFLADNLLGEPYYPALRVSGQILTALLFCVTASIFLMRPEGQSDPRTIRISGAGAIVSIFIMAMAAISMRRDRYAVLLYIAAGVVAIAVATFLAHEARERGRAAAADAYDAPPA